jgi:pyridoxine 5-phosphate synthase
MIPQLGVNIDHVATVRQARGVSYPDPVTAASVAEMAGADQITCHPRIDRRHVQDRDLEILARTVQTKLNIEIAATAANLELVLGIRPGQVTLVPEREGEVTTEGGLDLTRAETFADVKRATARLREAGLTVSIFADPDPAQVERIVAVGATAIEINTAAYAEATTEAQVEAEIDRIQAAAEESDDAGLWVAAGHGLHYHNVSALADLELIREYNIGHAIIARAIFTGLDAAVRDMKGLLG